MNLNEASIRKAYVHFIGNKLLGQEVRHAKKKLAFDSDDANKIVSEFFLKPFWNTQEFFAFSHSSDLKYNLVYNLVAECFDDENAFKKNSAAIADFLHENSTHPKIKPGELFVALFDDCMYDERRTQVIGIFKSESKQAFLKLTDEDGQPVMEIEEGLFKDKTIEKACIIFNTEYQNGFKVCIIDNQSKSAEAQYWKDDFLKLTPCEDSYHQTQNYLKICKEFVANQLPKEFEVSKTEQIDLLKRSLDYFKEKESFDQEEFTEEVFGSSDVGSSFQKFKQEYVEQHEMAVEDSFDVSLPAVKQQAKTFKSVLKLDKNFHVYIHGDRKLIEKGVESDGRKYYKIYYSEEL